MNKKLLIVIFLLCSVISLFGSKRMIIVFKNGTEIEYDTNDIEKVYYEGNSIASELEGKWYGDRGIMNIYINDKDIFSIQLENGYSWSGIVKRENDYLIFETPFPIPMEYFANYGIPDEIAQKGREIIIRPDKWLFKIQDSGNLLVGQKNCFLISWSEKKLFDIDYVERESIWQK